VASAQSIVWGYSQAIQTKMNTPIAGMMLLCGGWSLLPLIRSARTGRVHIAVDAHERSVYDCPDFEDIRA